MADFSITDSMVQEFQENGALCLRGAFNKSWMQKIERGIAKVKESPSQYSENLRAPAGPGFYFNDYCNWQRVEEIKDFACNSSAAEITGRLMNSKHSVFYHEHVLTKDPGSYCATPWHQDQPYYPVDGFKNCSIWLPVDPVGIETTIQFVKGSHRWGRWFCPRKFATFKNYPVEEPDLINSKNYEDVPDVDSNLGKYDILKWATEPGDCIVFHMLSLHGAPSNMSSVPRRVIATRWLGDDMVFAKRPWPVSPPMAEQFKPGDSLISEKFPLVWGA